MSNVKEHFNQISKNYDFWKKKNWYYYQNLKGLLKEIIPSQSSILDVGCGTGEILASLNPKNGFGIDISEEMIKIAREKYKNQNQLKFQESPAENFYFPEETFDYIIMSDLIEHLFNLELTIQSLKRNSKLNTRIVITMANHLWEPLLILFEKLKLKMPEGPHQRISLSKLEKILTKNDFQILDRGYRLLLPIFIPFLSDFVNKNFYKIPVLKNLGLITFLVFSKKI